MTLKEIKKAQLENEKLYDDKVISINEYIEKHFELLQELDEHIYKLENIHLEFFKNIKKWFRKKTNIKE
ncbi:hypothetical protein J2799_004497 [Chryseobacterium vietnamense]|uniref:hypothetical protein n=1 Tax=Chryseobacterium vietnamense TaxID=866785 RepID=UPI0028662306|nr:hypothetical protein [Chryseobacterium vietnamense]MDR6489947.1 hypothetical protein [Chryseobacterium vietnamense]